MKLLFCPKCMDVFKLRKSVQHCECKLSWGYYKRDGLHAVIGGDGVPLGADNASFIMAYRDWQNEIGSPRFTAFFISQDSERIEVE